MNGMDVIITHSTSVYINHFHKDYVITQDIFTNTVGEPDIIVSTGNR